MGRRCEVGPILAAAGIPNPNCTGEIEGLHERRKRSSGGSLINLKNLVPSCNSCNGRIEDEPEMRILCGAALVLREGDEEWDEVGARQDHSD